MSMISFKILDVSLEFILYLNLAMFCVQNQIKKLNSWFDWVEWKIDIHMNVILQIPQVVVESQISVLLKCDRMLHHLLVLKRAYNYRNVPSMKYYTTLFSISDLPCSPLSPYKG